MGSVLSDLRRHSQLTAFIIGLVLSGGGAILWFVGYLNAVLGSLCIGIGSSATAASLVAYFSPAGEEIYRKFLSLRITDVYASRKYVAPDQWVNWLREANHSCILLGIAHGSWCTDTRFEQALIGCLEQKKNCRVKVFFLDPSPSAQAVKLRQPEDVGRDTTDVIRRSIRAIWAIRQKLDDDPRNRLELYVYDATPSCGLTWVDNLMVVSHYLAGIPNPDSPVLVLERGKFGAKEKNLYEIYEMNMQKIEQRGSTVRITEANVNNYS